MVYQLVSSQQLLAKVYRDFKPTTQDWASDAIEWIGEVISRVGVYPMLEKTSSRQTVANHRTPFPCDLEALIAVGHCGYRLPYGSDVRDVRVIDSCGCQERSIQQYREEMEPMFLSAYNGSDYYTVNPGYILTTFATGTIDLYFTKFPTDAEGYPMVVDNYYLKEACQYQIVKNLQRRGELKGNWEATQETMEQYADKAGKDMAMPSPDQMDRLIATWARLIPNVDRANAFYAGGEQREYRNGNLNQSFIYQS